MSEGAATNRAFRFLGRYEIHFIQTQKIPLDFQSSTVTP